MAQQAASGVVMAQQSLRGLPDQKVLRCTIASEFMLLGPERVTRLCNGASGGAFAGLVVGRDRDLDIGWPCLHKLSRVCCWTCIEIGSVSGLSILGFWSLSKTAP